MFRFIIVFLLSFNCFGQAPTINETYPLQVDTFIGTDVYDSAYTITENILYKTGDQGDFEYSDIQLGDITSVDIINPLKAIVYYHDFNTVVFLDNRLNEIERVNFNDLPSFINTGAASNAGNNRLWLINTDNQQVEIYNYSTQIRTEISQPITDDIVAVASNFNFFYVLTTKEVRQYNIYGSPLETFKITEGTNLIQDNRNLIVITPEQLLYKSKKSTDFKPLAIQEILKVNLQLRQDLLYIYNGEELTSFSLNQPKK